MADAARYSADGTPGLGPVGGATAPVGSNAGISETAAGVTGGGDAVSSAPPESTVGEARMVARPRTLLANPAAVTTPAQRNSLRVLFSVIALGAVVFLASAVLWWKKGVRVGWTP
jgi:hypothetical protein